jgi:ADP-ribosylglycohydrolase
MKPEYLEKIYAGWLGKIIGIRLGAPVEGWTYEKIKNVYGDPEGYLVDYREFAADDDSNGPLFFLRALEDGKGGFDLSSRAVEEAILNYVPYEHGFFWWGGYGVSTEHTAYLNLRQGIPAPRSGSVEQNGAAMAEQIGGQIFIDTWGLVCPGNPGLAAAFAEKAAAATHGGNGVYGGVFVAACIAHAFDEGNIRAVIEKGLSYIPGDSEYARVVRAVTAYYDEAPRDWRGCFQYIYKNYGYDRYPGICHIIPNSAVMILALLYGEGDFSDTLNICNRCGWDTDCNVGNVAAIMGTARGLEGIDYQKWRRPINDFLACSSVLGSLNITDIPSGASYMAKLAWALAGEELPGVWKEIIPRRMDSCHFEYPGSTHAIRVRLESGAAGARTEIANTNETAFSGSRCLKVYAAPLGPGERVLVYKKTYYTSRDFHDSRYDPAFSPLVYPGQTVYGSAFLPEYGRDCLVRMYVHDAGTDTIIAGEPAAPRKGEWVQLSCPIPPGTAALIDEAGFAFDMRDGGADFIGMIDDLYFEGPPDYTIDFAGTPEDWWTPTHREITQFTRLKGLLFREGEELHLSCADFGEAYTGGHDWTDYTAEFTLRPVTGGCHWGNLRVQGAIRSYGAGFSAGGKLGLYKNENGYRPLVEIPFPWETGRSYVLTVKARGPSLTVSVDGGEYLSFTDTESPYLRGGIGLSVREGGRCAFRRVRVY